MEVRDWMTERVETVHPEDDLVAVRARFAARRVRQFPVVADGGLVGIVTDRDLRADHPPGATVASVMTRDPVTTAPAALIEDAAALLLAGKIGALPVVEHGALVGIISESDLLQALVELACVVEPTTMIELECEDGMRGAQRARGVLERHGAHVLWMQAVAEASGRLRVRFRVRAPIGHAPEQVLEEAGFRVSLCYTGGTRKAGEKAKGAPDVP
jgi:acetoin utilization protein AcuB